MKKKHRIKSVSMKSVHFLQSSGRAGCLKAPVMGILDVTLADLGLESRFSTNSILWELQKLYFQR